MSDIKLITKKGSTFHDFPYSHPQRKCFHCWIINVTPPGPSQCVHQCIYCYARDAVYSNFAPETLVYKNLPELVASDLDRLNLCPPISISNVSDPCQDIPELREEVLRLVRLLMERGVAFAINTKGDPSFLLDLPGLADYPLMFFAVTIEGTADVLRLISPRAPTFKRRLEAVSRLSGLGIPVVVRLDPLLKHVFQAVYGKLWFDQVPGLVRTLADAGARHIIVSTGRLSKRVTGRSGESGSWHRVLATIRGRSPSAADRFKAEYGYEVTWAGSGYFLRREVRVGLHRAVKQFVEASGMTYAVCQELPAEICDSAGIPGCEGIALPFTKKGADGRFHRVAGCTANCHVSCLGYEAPPCGMPQLITTSPLKFTCLVRGRGPATARVCKP